MIPSQQWFVYRKQSYLILQNVMSLPSLVEISPISCFCQHSKLEEAGGLEGGELFSKQVDPPWWLTGVYGPHRDDEKLAFLDELREVRSYCHGPWMLAGDFNMIYCSEDKNNENINRALMGRFRRFVNELELK